MRRSRLLLAFLLVLGSPSAGASQPEPPDQSVEAVLVRELRQLVEARDAAFAELERVRARRPGQEVSDTAEFRAAVDLQRRVEQLQARLEEVRSQRAERARLAALRDREAALKAELEAVLGDRGRVTEHPKYAQWQEVRREIAELERELGLGPQPTLSERLADAPQVYSSVAAASLSLGCWLGTTTVGMLVAFTSDDLDSPRAVAGFVVTALGASFGPSAGHYYADQPGRATAMGFLRLGLSAAIPGLIVAGFEVADEDLAAGLTILTMGVSSVSGFLLTLAILDAHDAPRAARRANVRAARDAGLVQVSPTLLRESGGDLVPALSLSGRF